MIFDLKKTARSSQMVRKKLRYYAENTIEAVRGIEPLHAMPRPLIHFLRGTDTAMFLPTFTRGQAIVKSIFNFMRDF